MASEFADYEYYIEELVMGADVLAIEREKTRSALQRASNVLVDETLLTPWERQRLERNEEFTDV